MIIATYSIGGYFVIAHWLLLMVIVLVAIVGYSINGYWWSSRCKTLCEPY